MNPMVVNLPIPENFSFPEMYPVSQQFEIPPALDVTACLDREWEQLKNKVTVTPGARIAVCVGSRRLASLAEIVRTVIRQLKSAGAKPFITSAMGSHGGATPGGQTALLTQRGISEETMGAPVEVTMAVVSMGEVDGIPLFMDRLACEADGIVLINRVKPHTDFTGPVESGMIKMLCIGLGNREGASFYHQTAFTREFSSMLQTAGRQLLDRCNIVFGVGLVENQNHQTCSIRMAAAGDIEATEKALLKKARTCLPRLPMDEMDVLIVDEMGKDISGAGLDPNVIGGKGGCLWSTDRQWPKITRIFVRKLTPATRGNAAGLGRVHVATPRLIDAIDLQTTAINAFTAACPEDCRLPLTVATEKEAVAAAISSIRSYTLDDLRVVHIKNTSELNHFSVSKGCLSNLQSTPLVRVETKGAAMAFDAQGRLKENH